MATDADPSQIEARKFKTFVTKTVDENYVTKDTIEKLLEKQYYDIMDAQKIERHDIEKKVKKKFQNIMKEQQKEIVKLSKMMEKLQKGGNPGRHQSLDISVAEKMLYELDSDDDWPE